MNTIFDTISDFFNETQDIFSYPKKALAQDCRQGRNSIETVNYSAITDKDGNRTGKRIEVLIPGFRKDEITLSMNGNQISLSAERKEDQTGKTPIKTNFRIRERVEFSFSIDEDTDREAVSGRLDNGILTIDMPFKKKNEKDDSVKIEIE